MFWYNGKRQMDVVKVCREYLSDIVNRVYEDSEVKKYDMTKEDEKDLDYIDEKIKQLQKNLCEKYSHYVIDDQCGKPEHRMCLYCNEGCSNAELS